jgi:hypothetical protein
MKFLARTTLKIILYMILFIVPITLGVALFSLVDKGTPLFNIGVRNVLGEARGLFVPSLFICYLFSTLLVVSLIDKMRVKSLFALHIPPILVGVIIGAVFALMQREEVPLPVSRGGTRVGYATILKRNALVDTEKYTFYLGTEGDTNALYVYSKEDASLAVDESVRFDREIRLDREGRRVVLQPGGGSRRSYSIPFRELVSYEGVLTHGLIRSYAEKLRQVYAKLRARWSALDRRRAGILLGMLLLSILMVTIPLSYWLNDHGWGFSGVVGIFLILGLFPYVVSPILEGINRLSRDPRLLGGYTYLLPAGVFIFLAIVLDVIVSRKGSVR